MAELPKLTFVLGGAASGKSAFAETLVINSNAPRVYLATSQIFDDEMAQKVRDHIDMRGENWLTIEEPLDPATALSQTHADQVVLLDCATMWLSNHMMADSDLDAQTDQLIDALTTCPARIVVVSNEVGMGIVPDNAMARRFRNVQGKLNQRLARAADLAVFVIAGLPQVLKGELP